MIKILFVCHGKIYAIIIEAENGTVIVGEADKMGRIDLLYQIIML